MPRVSIIIPVYNAEKYLGEAIESVLKQTYPDFELLLINDASTDRSKEICMEYAKKDDRIVLLENDSELHGPGPTRNIGLDHATGSSSISWMRTTGSRTGFWSAPSIGCRKLARIWFSSGYFMKGWMAGINNISGAERTC